MADPRNDAQLEARLYEFLNGFGPHDPEPTADQIAAAVGTTRDELRPIFKHRCAIGSIGTHGGGPKVQTYYLKHNNWQPADTADEPDPEIPADVLARWAIEDAAQNQKDKATRTRGRAPKQTANHGKPFQAVGWAYARTPRAIYRSDLSAMARLAYGVLADVRQTDTFKISRPILAKRMGVSESTAWLALAELIEAGWVTKVVQRQGGHGSNAYRFTDTVFDL
jgi:Helix-turn-helix domain